MITEPSVRTFRVIGFLSNGTEVTKSVQAVDRDAAYAKALLIYPDLKNVQIAY